MINNDDDDRELYNKQMQERKKLYSEMNNNNNKKENFSTQKDIQSYPSVADFNPDFANRLHSVLLLLLLYIFLISTPLISIHFI